MSIAELNAEEGLAHEPDQFSNLLAPVSRATFLRDWFNRAPLQIPGNARKIRDLPSVGDLLTRIRLGSPWQLRRQPEVYLNGRRIDSREVTNTYCDMDGVQATRPRGRRIDALIEAGATVACYGIQTIFPQFSPLIKDLASALHAEVDAHLIFSQYDKQGLGVHYDCADVFVLQIEGRKCWYVSEQRALNPIAGQGASEPADGAAHYDKYELHEGDLLYIPRGVFHYAVTSSDVSLHASVVAKLPTILDYLTYIVESGWNASELGSYISRFDGDVYRGFTSAEVTDVVRTLVEGEGLAEAFWSSMSMRSS